MKPVLVIGSINTDLVVRAPRLPRPGETLLGDTFRTFPGGKGANQAVGVARLGHPVALLGKLGRDRLGDELLSGLTSAGVDCRSIERGSSASGVALITTEEGGQNTIIVVAGANGDLLPLDVRRNENLIKAAGMVLLQLEIPFASIQAACEIAAGHGVPVMLDPAPAAALAPELLKRVTWLTPNETEAATLLGASGPIQGDTHALEICERLLLQGARNVVLKLGARGSFLALEDGTRTTVPPFPVEARDSTAAGDAFNAAFAVGLLRGMNPGGAARFASAAAAISVTREGAQPAMPTASEVEALLSKGDFERS